MNERIYYGRDFAGHGPKPISPLAILGLAFAASLGGAFLWGISEHAAQHEARRIAVEQGGKINP